MTDIVRMKIAALMADGRERTDDDIELRLKLKKGSARHHLIRMQAMGLLRGEVMQEAGEYWMTWQYAPQREEVE